MAETRTAYVAVPYEDTSGKHEAGEQVTFELKDDQDHANFDTLLRYGVVTKEQAEEHQAAQRTDDRNARLAKAAQEAQEEAQVEADRPTSKHPPKDAQVPPKKPSTNRD
jgi:hypothetical protein